MTFTKLLADLLFSLLSRGRDAEDTDEAIRLGLNEQAVTESQATPSQPVAGKNDSSFWDRVGGALIFVGLIGIVGYADWVNHGFGPFQENSGILPVFIATFVVGCAALLIGRIENVAYWTTQSGPGATVGLLVSVLIFLIFGAFALWIARGLGWF